MPGQDLFSRRETEKTRNLSVYFSCPLFFGLSFPFSFLLSWMLEARGQVDGQLASTTGWNG